MGSVISHKSASPDLVPELAIKAIPDDERIWVPQAPNLWFRPLLFDTVKGEWCNLLRVRKSGVLSRHLHPAPVYAYVIKGTWRYLEHDWIATEGSFVYEPPGEVHTLVVDKADEMITFFHVCGALLYVDENGKHVGHDDVHTKLRMCREHYAKVGLGEEHIRPLIR